MRRVRGLARLGLLALVAVALSGCTAESATKSDGSDATDVSGSQSSTSTPSDALVNLDADGKGTLTHVNLEERTSGCIMPDSPESRAIRREWRVVNVGIFDRSHGVRTMLTVPMWYHSDTTFVPTPHMPFPETLAEAVEHPEWAWDGAGTADLKFHMEDGLFVIDEVSRPEGNSSYFGR